jgi:hypothetical protein
MRALLIHVVAGQRCAAGALRHNRSIVANRVITHDQTRHVAGARRFVTGEAASVPRRNRAGRGLIERIKGQAFNRVVRGDLDRRRAGNVTHDHRFVEIQSTRRVGPV